MKKLNEFIDVISGIALQSEEISEDKSGIPILRGINITEGFIRHSIEIDRYYNKTIIDKTSRYLLEEKDLVIGMDGSKVGKNVALISKFDVGSILIQRVARIKALQNADINFIFQNIYSEKFQRYVDVVNTSSGIPHISLQQIKDFEAGFPATLSEQKKISDFLSLLDERIQTQNKIIKQLETLIKGLCQKLILQQVPNKKLKDCVSCHSSSLTESDVIDKNGTYPVYGATGIISLSENYQIDKDAILIIKDGSGVGKVHYGTDKFSVIGTLNYLTAKSEMNLKYIFFCLRFFNFEKYKVGSGIPHIYFKDYGESLIYCPSVEEQHKIEKLLSFIDEKINIEKLLLKKYETQKKHLLQNLFI